MHMESSDVYRVSRKELALNKGLLCGRRDSEGEAIH